MLWLCARLTPLSLSEIKLSGVTDVLDDLIRFPLPADVRGEHNEMSGGIKSAITIPLHLPHLNTNLVLLLRKIRTENISGALSWLGEKTGDTVQVRQNHQYSPDKTEMRRAQDDPVKIVHRKSICRLNRLGSVCWPRDVTSVFCHGYKRPWVSWSFTCFSKLSLS